MTHGVVIYVGWVVAANFRLPLISVTVKTCVRHNLHVLHHAWLLERLVGIADVLLVALLLLLQRLARGEAVLTRLILVSAVDGG